MIWTLRKFVIGKSTNVSLHSHSLGIYRVSWQRMNSFPQPPAEHLYFFGRNRAEKMYNQVCWWEARTSVWHEPAPREGVDANWASEPQGENIRASITDWLKTKGIVGIYLDTPHHKVDIQCAVLPPRIKPVLTKWGSIYVVDHAKD